ncbi:MAG: hypothetical protein M3036_13475 [Bifidobacteriales bacterium]|nr:hypothetical protein [Bifidobacteriales bacterium]
MLIGIKTKPVKATTQRGDFDLGQIIQRSILEGRTELTSRYRPKPATTPDNVCTAFLWRQAGML